MTLIYNLIRVRGFEPWRLRIWEGLGNSVFLRRFRAPMVSLECHWRAYIALRSTQFYNVFERLWDLLDARGLRDQKHAFSRQCGAPVGSLGCPWRAEGSTVSIFTTISSVCGVSGMSLEGLGSKSIHFYSTIRRFRVPMGSLGCI